MSEQPISDDVAEFSPHRRKRFSMILDLIDRTCRGKSDIHILDIGGTYGYWKALEPMWRDRPLRFTLINLKAETVDDPRFVSLAGDACSMPQFDDDSFDLVHSNSVIEHVGRWQQMKKMAAEVRRLAPAYYLQTPAFGFPIEPHFRAPLFHWLPDSIRIGLIMRFSIGFYPRAKTLDEAMSYFEDAILLDRRRMEALFPDARLVKERYLGLTKSFVVIRDGRAP